MNRSEGGGLSLSFEVEDVLEKLRENKEAHEAEYNKAVEGYKVKLKEDLQQALMQCEVDITEGKIPKVPRFNLERPNHHLEEYTTAISMLEMTVNEEITLNQSQYYQYVLDEWDWTYGFRKMSSSYL